MDCYLGYKSHLMFWAKIMFGAPVCWLLILYKSKQRVCVCVYMSVFMHMTQFGDSYF